MAGGADALVPHTPETDVDAGLEMGKAVALGALASIPVIGPVLREVVGVGWGDNRADRLHRFATQLGRNIEAIADHIDQDFVQRDEFEALAEEVFERIAQRRNDEKMEAYAAAVAHSAATDRPERRVRERFLDILDGLRPIHLEVLGRLVRGSPDWQRPPDVLTVGQVVNSKLAYALDGLAIDRSEMDDLERRGLVGSLRDGPTLLRAAEDIGTLLTPGGKAFLRFVTMTESVGDIDEANADAHLVPDEAEPTTGADAEHEAWLAQHRGLALAGLARAGKSDFFEVVSEVRPHRASRAQSHLLEAVKASNIDTFGWPIGVALSTEEARPRPNASGIAAEVDWRERGTYDYWSLSLAGTFYLLKTLSEDALGSPDKLFFNTRIVRVAETFLFLTRLYRHLGSSSDTIVDVTVRHVGLRDRPLGASGRRRLSLSTRTTRENEVTTRFEGSLGYIEANLVIAVKSILNPLFALYDFFEPADEVYRDIVEKYVAGEVT